MELPDTETFYYKVTVLGHTDDECSVDDTETIEDYKEEVENFVRKGDIVDISILDLPSKKKKEKTKKKPDCGVIESKEKITG